MSGTGPPRRRGGPQRIPRPPGSRVVQELPVWRDVAADLRRPTAEQVRQALAEAPPPRSSPLEGKVTRASAVLAPVYDHEGEAWVVLTRRSWEMRSHTGEVSFPGGGQEADDDTLWDTALRESFEEVHLDPDSVERIGELDHLSTVTSRSFIVPYVGLLPARPENLRPNPNEVDAILHVPLSELLADEVHREERWGVPMIDHGIHFFELYGDTIWGATGAMLANLLRWLAPVLSR